MKHQYLFGLLLFCCVYSVPAYGQTQSPVTRELERLEELNFTEQQVSDLFTLFLSRAPQLLDERGDSQRILREISPQALKLLKPEQRRVLQELDIQPQLDRFGSLNQDQRKRVIFDSARTLVHPSKREWLKRIEAFTDS